MSMERIRRLDAGTLLRGVMCAITGAFLIGALCAPDLSEIFAGLARICTLPAQLTKDYFAPQLGSVSGAMLNAALVGAVCCALMFLPGAKVNGGTVLGYFLTVGFATFGINILNILPLMLGVAVYARIVRKSCGEHLNFFMFATALSPIVTQVMFYYPRMNPGPAPTPLSVALALIVGVASGCAMPVLCAHAPAFHKGFDLYNAGPAAGFLCALLFAALYRVPGVDAPPIGATLGEGHPRFANVFCAVLFALCAAAGFVINDKGFRGYGRLLRDSGYHADFTAKYAPGLNLMHIGLYGLFILLYYDLIGATFTGATMGAVFCMLGCCCVGATPRNVWPVMLGYALMGLLHRLGVTAFALNAQAIVVGLCFASGLAPIAGEYGIPAGIVAGVLHYCLVTGVPALHGGFCLYNGGFTAGIVCFILVPVLERFRGKRGAGA